ncbi:MAG TPA: hypothetical protein VF239_16880 [Vicinamibacterales bacterium]
MSRFLMVALVAWLAVTDDTKPVPGFFDLAVTGGTATFDLLGLQPEERGSAIAVLARSMFSQGGSAAERAAGARRFITALSTPGSDAASENNGRPITIAAPLTEDHWRELVGPDAPKDLFAALISNRAVLLVAAGAVNTDASMRALLQRDRGLLRWIARTAPAAFWVAARSLAIDKDRVSVPGGQAAEPIWEALVGERVTRVPEFLRLLLTKDGGRVAWFFDAVSMMTPERRTLVLGTGPMAAQIEQTRALYQAYRGADSNWRMEEHPFLRSITDPWIISSRIEIDSNGVAPPAAQWFWDALFERTDLTRKVAAGLDRAPAGPVTLAWLTQRISSAAAKERRDRYEMVRFAQAVFGATADDQLTDVLVAVGSYRRYRALLLSLDRMGVTTPRVYSRAVEAARRIDELPGRNRRHAVIAFQSAVAILERARAGRGIDVSTADRVLLSLADVVEAEDRTASAITQWMLESLLDVLPPLIQPDQFTANTAYESRLLQALAGTPAKNAPVLAWEGLDYRVDYFSSEHARIKRIREQLTSPGLDAALAANNDAQIADALLVLIYTPALGDPEGPALLGGDIPRRHNFGTEGAAGVRRDFLAWSVPREQVGDGNPWHIEGSLLGLDLALARLSLRRLADNEMPVAPTINLNDLLTLARTVRVLNPEDLSDADRDRIVEAIARGRKRVADAGADLAAVLRLADEAGMSPAIKQTMAWTITRTPELAPSLFALRDFMWLGKPDVPRDRLDRWGVYIEPLNNRLGTAMPPPSPWENLGGRADGGLIATQLPDLTLRLAEETARLKLPAQLIPGMLTYATQDFWHDVDSRFPDDWPAMTRQALALSSSRVEDYVAALAGEGPLRPR